MRTLIRASVLAACVSALVPAAAAAQSCPRPATAPTGPSLAQARPAIVCLLNAERRAHGLPALREHKQLRKAARRYAATMVRRQFFSHNRRGLIRRVSSTGYLRHARHWALGENIAWGSDASGSPAAIVNAWMASPRHRRNILSRRFSRIGIGVALGAPIGGGAGATYVTDFGSRRR
jgi:uncharacterized protein YkwD